MSPGRGRGISDDESHAFESWMAATSTASVGLPLRAIIASIVLIM